MFYPGPNEVPIHAADPTDDHYTRHHSAHHFVHRAKESLTTRLSKLLCTIFLFLLFLAGLITFILWLSLRPHRPRVFISDFQIPGLGQPNGLTNASITYTVDFRNSNRKIQIHYDSISGTVLYRDQAIGSAPVLTEPFDQDPKNTTMLTGSLSGATLTVSSERWSEFLGERAAGSVAFRLRMTSVIKFEIYAWDTKRHRTHAGCDVAVGPNGVILNSYRYKRCSVYFT